MTDTLFAPAVKPIPMRGAAARKQHPGDRLLARIVLDRGCWTWVGYIESTGYGRLGKEYAHRVSFRTFNGPIPDGLEVDHTCFNRRCVRPGHLEAVTKSENNRRAWARRKGVAA